MKTIKKNDPELEIFAATLYAEARGEPTEGVIWVAWVIKNRANRNRSFWGGNNLKDVCLHPFQFECWNSKNEIFINENQQYERCMAIAKNVYQSSMNQDPTNGCAYYNNPDKEGYPEWTNNVRKDRKIANHQFYRDK